MNVARLGGLAWLVAQAGYERMLAREERLGGAGDEERCQELATEAYGCQQDYVSTIEHLNSHCADCDDPFTALVDETIHEHEDDLLCAGCYVTATTPRDCCGELPEYCECFECTDHGVVIATGQQCRECAAEGLGDHLYDQWKDRNI